MKLLAAIILVIALVFLGTQIYKFSGRSASEQTDFSAMQAKLNQVKLDTLNLQSELDYYANPVNLAKELRARFNYKSPGENMIIIVPPASSSAPSSQ